MRCALWGLSIGLWFSVQAQTATSVQEGAFNDPATWDCNCIPMLSDVVILHTVHVTATLELQMPMVHIMPSGVLMSDGQQSIFLLGDVINDGAVHTSGVIDTDGDFINNGLVSVAGAFRSHGYLQLGGASTLLTTIDLEIGGLVDGEGTICVSGYSVNYGTIQGEVDLCDGSPTTITPPIIDNNTGVVAQTVTFCAGDNCFTGLVEGDDLSSLVAWPVPAGDQVTVEGLPSTPCLIELRDALGRIVPATIQREGSRMVVESAHLPSGSYRMVVTTAGARRALPLIILH